MVDKSLLSEHYMEGHWDTPMEVSRIKLVAPIRECCLIKEHLLRKFAMEQLSCESMIHAMMLCANGGLMVANFVFPLHLHLYLGCVCLRMLLIASTLYLGFVVHPVELEHQVLALPLFGAKSMSLAVAKSFDMEHLKDITRINQS